MELVSQVSFQAKGRNPHYESQYFSSLLSQCQCSPQLFVTRYSQCQAPLIVLGYLDFETQPQHEISAFVQDSKATLSSTVVVKINNMNEPPTQIFLSVTRVTENSRKGTLVGDLKALDPEDTDSHAFTLVPTSTMSNAFEVIGNELVVANQSALNFEASSTLNISIQATDNGSPTQQMTQNFTIEVIDINEKPARISPTNFSVEESARIGTLIGVFEVDDPDNMATSRQNHVCSVISNSPLFIIEEKKLLVNRIGLDFERQKLHVVTVSCSDLVEDSLSLQTEVVVNILNTNEAPRDLTLSSQTVSEAASIGDIVSDLSTTDPDNTGSRELDTWDTFNYILVANIEGDSFSAEDSLPHFSINASSLVLTRSLNYEENPIHRIWIKSFDQEGAFIIKEFIIQVLDANDVPSDILLSSHLVRENTPGSFVGTLRTIDEDSTQFHSYSIVASLDSDGELFILRNNSLCVILLVPEGSLLVRWGHLFNFASYLYLGSILDTLEKSLKLTLKFNLS